MTLDQLLDRLPGASLTGEGSVVVTGISHDSRQIRPGWLFAACPGHRRHGLEFLDEAIERGAAAVLTDRSPDAEPPLPWLTAPAPREAMAAAAWALAGDPQLQLDLIAVTGTNGKSTTAHLVSRILEASGRVTGFLGTLGYELAGERVAAERTTPEATDLAFLLRRLIDRGGTAAVMEVSSHALVQSRLAGLIVDVAVWTNLTRDHLDYHGDMEGYFAAKRLLFTDHLAPDGRRVLPSDEPWGARLLEDRRSGDLSWGLEGGDIHPRAVQASLDGTAFTLCLPDGEIAVELPLLGLHNLRNGLAAAAAAHAAGASPPAIARGLGGARPLPGRLEPVETRLPFKVFVDYAHTPDGLRSMLAGLRGLTERRLIVVFGAGGDRDQGKRAPMGQAVGELADVAIVTSDNPRTEDPAAIADAVAAGVRAAGSEPVMVLDRRAAIARALELADSDSVVIVAGKGHEEMQIVGQRLIPFSDRGVVQELVGGA
jgi:UDP-N-acetylmuramoyl-L-alanyl-D-glutamate--2,6-diaminopimelate ligase